MMIDGPEEKAGAPVSTDAECSPAGIVPVSRDADGEVKSHEGRTTGESYPRHQIAARGSSAGLVSPSMGHSGDALYPSSPGEHDLDTSQAMVSIVLIVVTITVACILVIMVTRHSKGYRAGLHIEVHHSPSRETSWPPH
ncbi:uncharacterized protein LOC125939919 [Dermacentor silvarum]|uniref:uncharacterized protein LOC125939919 n=1 Tax=Dermacentor silvarum TaxID=543639 RepID=UPI0021012FCE|nr:uncharacterized protein LOC125939919 [Dermacentor silvarum]